jgi:hypothetical protein
VGVMTVNNERIERETKMKATEAKQLAAEINAKCSECFTGAKAVKQFGQWVIKIGGGRESCYGRTIESVESAHDTIRIFKN